MSVFKEGWQNYKSLWTAEKYVGFKGRASRREYWTTVLIIFITELIVSIPDMVVSMSVRTANGFSLFSTIYAIAILLPSLSLTFRRLHDVGRSGWWIISECIVAAVMMISLCSAVIAGAINMTFSRGFNFVDAGMISLLLFGALLAVVCVTIQIIVFVFTLLKGQTGPNKYGEAPEQCNVVILPQIDVKAEHSDKCECTSTCCNGNESSSDTESEKAECEKKDDDVLTPSDQDDNEEK